MALTFRTKKIDRNIKRKIFILLMVFIGSLVFFEFLLNYEKRTIIKTEASESLPVVSTVCCDREINFMRGFLTEMTQAYLIGPETPVADDKVYFNIYPNDTEIDSADYEMSTIENGNVLTKGKIKLSGDDNKKTGQVDLKGKMESGKQYFMKVTLDTDDREAYYYFRVVSGSQTGITSCIDFADSIHTAAISKDRDLLNRYMEPEGDYKETALDEVNIKSSVDRDMYNSLQLEMEGNPVISVNEYLNGNMELTYSFILRDINSPANKYRVSEYMRVKYNEDRMWLADYDRKMTQIFSKDSVKMDENGFYLGITRKDSKFMSNETGTIVLFEKDGNIYEYNQNTGNILTLYEQSAALDPKEYCNEYQKHDVRLLNVDEGGSATFAVYGYMNHGIHEGENGVAFYHYDDGRGITEEDMFISSSMSYQYLKNEYCNTLYRSSDDSYYMMADGYLYKMSAKDNKTKTVFSGMTESQYKASKNSRYISWIDEEHGAKSIHILDLETGKQFDITADDGECLVPLVYMQQDFVYGKAKSSDVFQREDGTYVTPMYEIVISNVENGEAVTEKSYPQNGSYISDVYLDGSSLFMNRISGAEGGWAPIGTDVIKDTLEEAGKVATMTSEFNAEAGTIYRINMGKSAESASFNWKDTKRSLSGKTGDFTIPDLELKDRYFLLVGDNVLKSGKNLKEFIQEADEIKGTVVDNRQKTVWAESRRDFCSKIEVNLASMDRLKSEADKNVRYIDLTGCTMKQILFYVSNRYPVYTTFADKEYLLIGYDAFGITVYDPQTGGYAEYTRGNMEKLLEESGNVFKTYTD